MHLKYEGAVVWGVALEAVVKNDYRPQKTKGMGVSLQRMGCVAEV